MIDNLRDTTGRLTVSPILLFENSMCLDWILEMTQWTIDLKDEDCELKDWNQRKWWTESLSKLFWFNLLHTHHKTCLLRELFTTDYSRGGSRNSQYRIINYLDTWYLDSETSCLDRFVWWRSPLPRVVFRKLKQRIMTKVRFSEFQQIWRKSPDTWIRPEFYRNNYVDYFLWLSYIFVTGRSQLPSVNER